MAKPQSPTKLQGPTKLQHPILHGFSEVNGSCGKNRFTPAQGSRNRDSMGEFKRSGGLVHLSTLNAHCARRSQANRIRESIRASASIYLSGGYRPADTSLPPFMTKCHESSENSSPCR